MNGMKRWELWREWLEWYRPVGGIERVDLWREGTRILYREVVWSCEGIGGGRESVAVQRVEVEVEGRRWGEDVLRGVTMEA